MPAHATAREHVPGLRDGTEDRAGRVASNLDPRCEGGGGPVSDGMPFGGRWIYEIEPAPAGAIVTITEEGEVYNPIFRFVSRYLMGHHASASSFLSDLGAHFGEDVIVDIVR